MRRLTARVNAVAVHTSRYPHTQSNNNSNLVRNGFDNNYYLLLIVDHRAQHEKGTCTWCIHW